MIGLSDHGCWFAEGEAVKFAASDFASLDLVHFLGNEVDRAADSFAAGRKVCPGSWILLVTVAHDLFSLVGNHDLGSGLGDPDHFANGAFGVGEEVDAADMEDAVEDLGAKGKVTGFSLEEACGPVPFSKFFSAFAEHAPGEIEAVEINVRRKIAEVCAGADADFEHTRVWLDLEFVDDLTAKVGSALDQAVKSFSQIVARGNTIVQGLVFQI